MTSSQAETSGRELLAFERDPYLTAIDVVVLAGGIEADRPYAVLDDTICFPEGGGQPSDRGLLAGVEVVDVQRTADGGARHYLSQPVPAGPARLVLDWPRRYDLMQQHTAQHLLSAIAADRFGWHTTSFHLGPELCDVELGAPALDAAQLAALEEAVMVEVRAARSVAARRVPLTELQALGERVRSRGLPEGLRGDVRLVEIAGIDLNTCGGTHLRLTAEIESTKLLGTDRLRGGTRLYWVAGARVRRQLARREEQAAALRSALGAGDVDLVEVAQRKVARLEQADRAQRGLLKELAAATAGSLLAADDRVAVRHFEDRDGAFLQDVGRAFAGDQGSRLALLTAGAGDRLAFALVATRGAAVDMRELGQQVAALLEGRGGGTGQVYQGKARSLTRTAEARSALEAALGGA